MSRIPSFLPRLRPGCLLDALCLHLFCFALFHLLTAFFLRFFESFLSGSFFFTFALFFIDVSCCHTNGGRRCRAPQYRNTAGGSSWWRISCFIGRCNFSDALFIRIRTENGLQPVHCIGLSWRYAWGKLKKWRGSRLYRWFDCAKSTDHNGLNCQRR